jgi:hypothetical protein
VKKADVKVGARYEARVSGVFATVRITHFDLARGKFTGVNEKTNREVKGDFRRLRREVQQAKTLMDRVVGPAYTVRDGRTADVYSGAEVEL